MPLSRPLRPEFPGALWRITSRGNEHRSVFLDDEDRERFLALLGKVAEDFNRRVYKFVLMSNHDHLMPENLEPTLSRGMRQWNGIYTLAFNGGTAGWGLSSMDASRRSWRSGSRFTSS